MMPIMSGKFSCIRSFNSSRLDWVRQSAFVYCTLKLLKFDIC